MSASETRRSTVEDFLAQGLDCAIDVDADGDPTVTRFTPADRPGELVLDDDLATQADGEALLARLRRDDVASLLRRGERVKLTAIATEILPGRRVGHE